jgi:hypothetical protein
LEEGAGGVSLASLRRLERELARGVITGGDLGVGALGIAVLVASVADGVLPIIGTVAISGSVRTGVTGLRPWRGKVLSFFVHVSGRVAWSFLLVGVASLELVSVDFFLLRLVMVSVCCRRSLRRN